MRKSVICLDFDGVVHSYESGWQGPRNIPDDPVPGALEFMLRALHEGFDVVIHSSRARYFGGIAAMRAWLRKHAGTIFYDSPAGPGLEDVRFTRWKPPAIATLDDRAVRFTGTFPKPKELAELRPWNGKATI